MDWTIGVILSTLFVAYCNGANDNFKGVATLLGSGTTSYRKAISWATITTLAGSLTAFFFAAGLIKTFSGKGLVPDQVVSNPEFLLSVSLAASLTVFLAARLGIPISTTHSLTGALVGAGFIAVGGQLKLHALYKIFFLPLLISPCLSILMTIVLYPIFRYVRLKLGVKRDTCLCVGKEMIPVSHIASLGGEIFSLAQLKSLDIMLDDEKACRAKAVEVYSGKFLGINIQRILDAVHFISAGTVCFARGLNDTPKIVALLVTSAFFGLPYSIAFVAVAMALGGLLSAKKVAETMSYHITSMNHGEGLTANFITAFLVIGASGFGLPVSTTHVSCGALFGIGLINKKANYRMIMSILSAWVLTLPFAILWGGFVYWILK